MLSLDSLGGLFCYRIYFLITDRKGAENPIVDNLSRLENVLDDPLPIDDSFPDEQLAAINVAHNTPWYADYANYIFAKYLPPSFTYQQKKNFFYDLRHYFWDDPHLYKEGVDGIIRRCVPEHEQGQILWKCHSEAYAGHHCRCQNRRISGRGSRTVCLGGW